MKLQRPIVELSTKDFDPEKYEELSYWDPNFWEKVTHVLTESHREGNEFISHFTYYARKGTFYGKLDGSQGYVYILESPSQPGICKIGSTGRTPEERCREINRATGVLVNYRVTSAFPCKGPETIEKEVHRKLTECRVNPQKEGFYISREEAEKVIQKIIRENGAEILAES